jgi:hypothetical protein
VKKRARAPRPAHAHTVSAWQLFKASWRDYRRDWKGYLAIIAVVGVPVGVAGLFSSLAEDPIASVFINGAIVVMNVALLWAIVQREHTGKVPGPGSAYYDGSVALLRFLVTVVIICLMLIPALFGTVLYLLGMDSAAVYGTAIETVLIGFISLLLAMLSAWMFARFGLAPIIVVTDGLRPLAALRYSRQLTLRRFWRIFARYAMFFIYAVIICLPLVAISYFLVRIKEDEIAGLFFGAATTVIVLPLAYLYLLHLYRSLQNATVITTEPAHPHASPEPAAE